MNPSRTEAREQLSRLLRQAGAWITVEDAARVLGLERSAAAKRLARWAEQGWLRRVQRGHYAPVPLERASLDAPLEEPWIAVPHLFEESYIGGWTAAQHWDLTEQVFRDICVFAVGRRRRLERAGATYAVFPRHGEDPAGVRTHWIASTRVPISDLERTLVDMLNLPATGPGIQHVADCLDVYSRSSRARWPRLLEVAERVGSGAVFKRLGFLLERAQLAPDDWIECCWQRRTQGLAKLDPDLSCPRVVSRWRLRVPLSWLQQSDD